MAPDDLVALARMAFAAGPCLGQLGGSDGGVLLSLFDRDLRAQ